MGKNAVEDMNKMGNEDCIDKQKTIRHIQDLVTIFSEIQSDSVIRAFQRLSGSFKLDVTLFWPSLTPLPHVSFG